MEHLESIGLLGSGFQLPSTTISVSTSKFNILFRTSWNLQHGNLITVDFVCLHMQYILLFDFWTMVVGGLHVSTLTKDMRNSVQAAERTPKEKTEL